jgi:two-component system, NarL family, response regulator NreC
MISSGRHKLAIVPKAPLTKRELEVLYLMAEGLTTKAVAGRLDIAFKTASCHRSHILHKLNVRSTVGAIRWAIREGVIDP